jgi:hypothetical protein
MKTFTLQEMVEFVRQSIDASISESRLMDPGFLVQCPDGELYVLMTPSREKVENIAEFITVFFDENGINCYCFMSGLGRRTKVISLYAASREGDQLAQQLELIRGSKGVKVTEQPANGHPFLNLFPRILH